MMAALRPDLNLLGSFSHAPDPPITVQVSDRFAEFRDFLSLSLPAKSTSRRIHAGDQPIQSASPVSDELTLSLSPPAEFPWRSIGEDHHERSVANSSSHNISSTLNFRFEVSWGSKNKRHHALKRKRNLHHQKPPIHPIRVCNRSTWTIGDKEKPPICPIRVCNRLTSTIRDKDKPPIPPIRVCNRLTSTIRDKDKPPIPPIRVCKQPRSTIRNNEKPLLCPIRVSKRPRWTIGDKELVMKEEIAASGLLMLANQNPWKITKILTESDLNLTQSRLLISKALVQQHIIPNLDQQSRKMIHSKDGLSVSVRDCDTGDNKVFELKLKWWNSSRSYNFQSGWIKNFVNRRNLHAGDQIGLFWSPVDNMFVFSVLQ